MECIKIIYSLTNLQGCKFSPQKKCSLKEWTHGRKAKYKTLNGTEGEQCLYYLQQLWKLVTAYFIRISSSIISRPRAPCS